MGTDTLPHWEGIPLPHGDLEKGCAPLQEIFRPISSTQQMYIFYTQLMVDSAACKWQSYGKEMFSKTEK